MTSSREVFAKRKYDLAGAYTDALELMKAPNPDEWDIKALSWCLIDLIKRDARSSQHQNLQVYARQLSELEISETDEVLTGQRQQALRMCQVDESGQLRKIITAQEVFAKRKSGCLDEAYQMAIELMNDPQRDDWASKAFAWCLIDLIKREYTSPRRDYLEHYAEQLRSIDVEPGDEALTKGKSYALKLSDPNAPELQKAKELSKAGKHFEAANIYKQLFSQGVQTEELQTSLAWELYRLVKAELSKEHPNYYAAKQNLNNYMKLDVEKPSLLHTCFLQQADKIAREGKLDMAAFAMLWNLEFLREEDFEQNHADDGKVYEALGVKVIMLAAKTACKNHALEKIQYLAPYIDQGLRRYPDNLWLMMRKCQSLLALGDANAASELGRRVVKNKPNDYWAWELMGDVLSHSPEQAMACFSKALLCSKDIGFTADVKLKLAKLMLAEGDAATAKREVDEIVIFKNEQGHKISSDVQEFMSRDWYVSTEPTDSNLDWYRRYGAKAEEILYQDLHWQDAILGEKFTVEGKSGKPKRKLFIQLADTVSEIVIPDSKIKLDVAKAGLPVKIKGEADLEGRFQVFAVALRRDGTEWDIFPEQLGIVDHVNPAKQLIHFLVSKTVEGVIPFKDLPEQFNEGDVVALKLSKYTSRHGVRHRVVSIQKSFQSSPSSLIRHFDEEVRVDNGMGFTDSDIFIPPPMVDKNTILDGSRVTGTAILSFNKKRSRWGWKAFSVECVDVESGHDLF